MVTRLRRRPRPARGSLDPARPAAGPQAVLALASLGSGAALVVAIVARTSLALTLPLFGLLALAMTALWCLRVPRATRAAAGREAAVGAAAGIAATLAYDAVRLLVVWSLHLGVRPFDTWLLFGQLILGGGPGPAAWAAGTAYHYLNGMLFAVAYFLLLAGRWWWLGPLWGLGLETLMLLVYPGWLNLRLVMAEFTVASLTGHLAYGTALGVLGQRRRPWRRPAPRTAR